MAEAADIASVAIIGMAGRFPGAGSVEAFWSLLERGESAIRALERSELRSAGVPEELLRDPDFVARGACLEGIDRFDAEFFGFAPREAAETDPQQRLLLECAYHALESAGYAPRAVQSAVGVFVGTNRSTYFLNNLHPALDARRSLDDQKVQIAADKSYAATRIAHALNLDGPALCVDTACSTSLVAVHMACRALLDFQCDMALAGGASINVPQEVGYLYRDGGILAPDGVCRAFDAEARGTVFGNAVGLVVLKRLQDALDDGDEITAVIRGSAVNNDAAGKVSFWAPGVRGQSQVILAAQQVAGVGADDISYVDGHGTGTPLGDPVEVMALTEAFRHTTARRQYCALTSTKPNVGHLEAVAGLASLIRMALALQRGVIPPSANCATPSPRIDWQASPFYVNTAARCWTTDGGARRIGAVSSFGIGGTNAHAVLEEPPARSPGAAARVELWPVSAASSAQCERAASALLSYLGSEARAAADVARTLQQGREPFAHRSFAVVARDQQPASLQFTAPIAAAPRKPRLAFLFPGQGSQRSAMFARLYDHSALFRAELDACFAVLNGLMPVPAAQVWRAGHSAVSVHATRFTQPMLFATEYALARYLEALGAQADFMLGHSLGEYVAACLAGVFSLEDALRLLVVRGQLCESSPVGAMLAVPMSPADALRLARDRASLAAQNAPGLCVLSGTVAAIEAIEADLAALDILGKRLRVDRAFHSPLLQARAADLRAAVRNVKLRAPTRAYVSNLSGELADEQVCDPEYWVRHLLSPVQFAGGLSALRRAGVELLLEVGPGTALAQLAARNEFGATEVISCGARGETVVDDALGVFTALGMLWQKGVTLDWERLREGRGRRTRLPGYPFAAQRFWRDAPERGATVAAQPEVLDLHEEVWVRLPSAEISAAGQSFALLREHLPSCDEIAAQLRARGARVRIADTLAALEPDDAACLLVLGIDAQLPGPGASGVAQRLAAIAGEMRALGHCAPSRLLLLVHGAHEVDGRECLSPSTAMQEAALRVIAIEADLSSTSIDVPADARADEIAAALVHAASSADSKQAGADLLAIRGRFLWRRDFALVPQPQELAPQIRPRGVYLITGGAGRIGREFARYLVRHSAARGGVHLLMVGRRAADAALDTAWVAELSAAGCTHEYRECDVGVAESFGALLDEWLQRHGRIDGVMHSAGLAGEGLSTDKDIAAMTAVLAAKLDATDILLARLAERAPDFIILNSSLLSLTGVPGQSDYAAANRYLDLRAREARRHAPPVVAVNWDAWRGGGMARREASRAIAGQVQQHTWKQTDWMVAGHRILGHHVAPGSAWVDMAATLAIQEFGAAPVSIRELVFPAPLVVPPAGVQVQARVNRRGAELHGEIFSLDAAERETVHARFTAQHHPEPAAAARFRAGELGEVTVDGLLASVRYGEFGAPWHCLQACRADASRVFASFALPAEHAAQATDHWCHPALWDAATGLLTGAALLRHESDRGEAVYLPREYRAIRLFGRLGSRVDSYCRLRDAGGDLLLDVVLVDPATQDTVAEIEGLRLARVRLAEVTALLGAASVRTSGAVDALLSTPIDTADAAALFDRILATRGAAQLVVTRGPVEKRLAQLHDAGRAAASVIATRRAAAGAAGAAAIDPPRTPLEMQIAAVWREVLGVGHIGRDANFFALGGHSLMATQLAARLRQSLSLDLPLEAVLEQPTIAGIAALVESRRLGAAATAESVTSIPPRGAGIATLSLAQQRLWSVEQREGPSGLYNEGRALLIEGPLCVDSLRGALALLLRRHEVLRSSYPAEQGAASVRIAERLAAPLDVIDMSSAAGDTRESALSLLNLESQRPFDLATAPLLRCVLVRLAGERHLFGLFMHHIVCDGLSLGIACEEIVEGYEAARAAREPRLPALPLQYFDFAAWQRGRARRDSAGDDEAYWAQSLAGITPVPLAELPGDGAVLNGAVHRFDLDAALVTSLDALARRHSTTTFALSGAAFALLVAQRSGRNDVLISTPVTERRDPQLAETIGLFVNSLPLRLRIDRDASIATQLRAVHTTLTGALAHQELPFESMVASAGGVGDRRLAASTLSQLRFVYLDYSQRPLRFEQLRVSALPVNRRLSKFELMLTLGREADGAHADFEYKTALYSERWIADLAESYRALLQQLVAATHASVAQLLAAVDEEWGARKRARTQHQQQARRSGLARLRQESLSKELDHVRSGTN
jgi:phthiocerol/phenolphthiocerol synthesis type-I polyketide synthase E